MTDIVTLSASVEAFGHPTECTEPAPGSVVQEALSSLTITNSSGQSKQVASINTANIDIPSHCHTYSSTDGCTNCYAHSIDPRTADASSSLTLNGSPIYIVGNNVQDDPGTGNAVDIIDAGINTSVTETAQ